MKKNHWNQLIVGLGTLAVAVTALLAAETATAPKDPEPLPYYGTIAKKVARVVPAAHLLQHPLDDSISQKAWTNLITLFDFDHSYFLQSDLDRFSRMQFQIDDAIKEGDVSFGFEVYRVFRTRLQERYAFVTNELKKPVSFTVDESYRWRRKDAPWPANAQEQDELWRKRVKNELLVSKLARELEAEKAASNKTAKAAAESAKEKNSSTNKPALTPEENIAEKYKQYMLVIQDMDEESILQRYLSAVTMAYDPHSEYMSPMRKEDFDIDMNLTLCGIGAQLRSTDGTAMISEIIPGGPADRDKRPCKLVKGDKIIGVGQGDGEIESILHWPLNKAVRKIRGTKGSKVVLRVIPASDPSGTTTKLVDLIREEIKLEEQAATGHVSRVTLKDGSVRALGYVRLPTFYGTMEKKQGQPGFRSATADVAAQIAKFNSANVSGLILDLRNNGGGSLREAIDLVGLFIRSGPAVQVREPRQTVALKVQNELGAMAFRKPLIVMINRASASASEIVAAALQDYGRAVIVGDTKSHGKGSVQSVMPLGNPKYGSIKVTTASFYRINGSSTQIKGVHSDIVIPSALDGLEMMGEEKLPGALPWTQMEPALYIPVCDVSKFIPQLKEKSAVRLAKNERYARHARNAQHIRDVNERVEVPLEINERRKLMKSEDELQKLEDEEEENANQKNKDKDDVILEETFNILSDLIDLQGDEDIPMETEGDLRSRMMRIFGVGI
ncbi:MAG: carboxy terminal-processing peptidase [Kiritimatiellae bacterium]|nr:carboxy terminal-processing peptidase [Kiritimatiellia bacterium]